jgi:phosphohistidine phosphatase
MAKAVYVLRHAKSSWDDPSLHDADRPLAPRGEKAARALRRHLKDEGIAPDLVLCSPARRARETVDLVRPGLPEGTRVTVEDRLYGAGPTEVLDMLRRLPEEVHAVMVVGHNPTLQKLTLALGSGPTLEPIGGKFPTGALAELSFSVERWEEVAEGGGELTRYVIPRDLR